MRLSKIDKIARISLVFYALLFLVALNILFQIIGFTNHMFFNPREYEEISLGGTEIPIMRPFEDAIFYVNPEALEMDPSLHTKLQNNEYIFETIYGLAVSAIFFLLLLQLAKLINSIKTRDFYSTGSLVNVKRISYIIGAWVLIDFIAYQCLQYAMPLSVIEERINYVTIKESFISNVTLSVDILKLLIAYAFYAVSVVFKAAAELKEQTDLTV
jgi:hypothetical protein